MLLLNLQQEKQKHFSHFGHCLWAIYVLPHNFDVWYCKYNEWDI